MRDVALIVLDTLRWDFSDVFSSLKEFKKILGVSTSPWTFPSHVSFLTGLTTSHHGVFEKNYGKGSTHYFNPWEWDSLPKYFRMNGYSIFWITCNPYLSKPFGFDGFDELYVISDHFNTILGESKEERLRNVVKLAKNKLNPWYVEKGVKKVRELLEKIAFGEPNFVFINLMEVHEPYLRNDPTYTPENLLRAKVEKASGKMIRTWREGYIRSALYLNKQLKRVLDILKQKLNDPLFVVIGDHGQLLGEYEKLGHEVWLYDELVHVPVWINENINVDAISLADIPNLITSLLEKRAFTPSEVFFSESYGPASYPDTMKELVQKYKDWRIAAENKDGKLVFNVDQEVVEFKRGKTKGLLEKIKEYSEDPGAFSPGI